MQIEAYLVKPGDRVRGLGLVIEYVEPEDDFHTRLVGFVQNRDDELEMFTTSVVVPNTHRVNVRRSDANFRADQVAALRSALTDLENGALGDEPSRAWEGFLDDVAGIVQRDRNHDGLAVERVNGINWAAVGPEFPIETAYETLIRG